MVLKLKELTTYPFLSGLTIPEAYSPPGAVGFNLFMLAYNKQHHLSMIRGFY